MQKIELSSRPTVSITEGWRGSRGKPPRFITSPHRLRQMRRFAAVDSSSPCRELLIIVKCQCEISNRDVRVLLPESEHSDAQVLHMNFLKNFNYPRHIGERASRLCDCFSFRFIHIRELPCIVSVSLLQTHTLILSFKTGNVSLLLITSTSAGTWSFSFATFQIFT